MRRILTVALRGAACRAPLSAGAARVLLGRRVVEAVALLALGLAHGALAPEDVVVAVAVGVDLGHAAAQGGGVQGRHEVGARLHVCRNGATVRRVLEERVGGEKPT